MMKIVNVRETLLYNKNTPIYILEKLAEDKDNHVSSIISTE